LDIDTTTRWVLEHERLRIKGWGSRGIRPQKAATAFLMSERVEWGRR